MNNHSKHTKFSVHTRLLTVERVRFNGWPVRLAAAAIGASRQIVYRWLKRYAAEGEAGLEMRSSRPHCSPTRLPKYKVNQIEEARRNGRSLNYIVQTLLLVRSTVWRWLKRLGLSRKPRPPAEPVIRYEAKEPGELLHIDVKKLRGFAWTGRKFIDSGGRRQRGAPRLYLHVCIDSRSRYSFCQILKSENGSASLGFIRAAREHFTSLGVAIKRILTDNGAAYRGLLLKESLENDGIEHTFTKVRRPQTNGKAERFIRTAMEEWGNVRYETSKERDAALPTWLKYYNYQRNHSAIGHKPPVSRLPVLTTS
jgi:transposase InsO family protein